MAFEFRQRVDHEELMGTLAPLANLEIQLFVIHSSELQTSSEDFQSHLQTLLTHEIELLHHELQNIITIALIQHLQKNFQIQQFDCLYRALLVEELTVVVGDHLRGVVFQNEEKSS